MDTGMYLHPCDSIVPAKKDSNDGGDVPDA